MQCELHCSHAATTVRERSRSRMFPLRSCSRTLTKMARSSISGFATPSRDSDITTGRPAPFMARLPLQSSGDKPSRHGLCPKASSEAKTNQESSGIPSAKSLCFSMLMTSSQMAMKRMWTGFSPYWRPASSAKRRRPSSQDSFSTTWGSTSVGITMAMSACRCKEAETLVPGQFLDYLGLNIGRDNDGNVCLSMQTYIERACHVLDVQPRARGCDTPITAPIDPESGPITPKELKKFLTGLGMLGWLAQTGRPDVAYCYSRIGQHSAKPSRSALQAVLRAFQYLLQHKTLSLSAPI